MPISAVHEGDHVLTTVEGQLLTTRVVRNVRSRGSFDFFKFEVRSNNTVSTLKVTPQHGMLLIDQLGEMRFSSPADIRIGDEMRPSEGSAWKVSRIGHYVGAEKFALETTEGSVLTSGLLISTICEEEISAGVKVYDIMAGWKARHQYSAHPYLRETPGEAEDTVA
ncbi:nacht nucleoside triphosphatase [Trichoderma arundinaceum]|uniref:Nacht nucleoside triphosphatase n=1 Tax=Trichoderma arundinaceum TaxID=490622 RepID=A0A395NAV9_TRIAR|nr:nacht nucleoside triphosphatase [Trichoderma arundinaceum]